MTAAETGADMQPDVRARADMERIRNAVGLGFSGVGKRQSTLRGSRRRDKVPQALAWLGNPRQRDVTRWVSVSHKNASCSCRSFLPSPSISSASFLSSPWPALFLTTYGVRALSRRWLPRFRRSICEGRLTLGSRTSCAEDIAIGGCEGYYLSWSRTRWIPPWARR